MTNYITPDHKLYFIIHNHPENICQPVVPRKASPSEVGYDLTLTRKVKKLNKNTTMYDSSISVVPPIGHYIEIIPRSSLAKYGYMLANSVGIIDPTYRGTLKVVLTKVVDNAEELTLPLTRCQLILRKLELVDTEVISADDVRDFEQSTSRGAGGFGSTD